jgi:YHS domain-containing protein
LRRYFGAVEVNFMRVLMVLSFVAFALACTKADPAPQALSRTCGPAATCGEDTTAVVVEEPHACGDHHEPDDEELASLPEGLQVGDEATCVVMNRKFVLTETTPTSIYNGKAYAFCCDGCKEMFDKDPAKYAQLAMK